MPVAGPGERIFVLDVPYDQRAIAQAYGGTWNAAVRQTIYVGRTLPHGLRSYASSDFSWERWVEDDINGRILAPQAPKVAFTPRPHQTEAINKIVAAAASGWRGFLEADDVGVGKTLPTVIAAARIAKARGLTNVLIISPKGVKPHWRNTIAASGEAAGLRLAVVNYDATKRLLTVPKSAQNATRTRTRNKRIAAAGQSLVRWDVVIFDESHYLKNQDAQRTQAANRLARYAAAAATAPFVIWTSATAGQNPAELSYLSPLLAQITGSPQSALADFGQWLLDNGFAVEWNSFSGRWEWLKTPSEATPEQRAQDDARRMRDIERINKMLFSPDSPSIRRLPSDIAGWPEVDRILYPVELSTADRTLYTDAWTEFRRELQLAQRGSDPKRGIVQRLRFRQKSSLLRVPGTIDAIIDALDNGRQVAVSCEFLESVDAIADTLAKKHISCAIYTGKTPDKEAQRLSFQRGEHQVILFTVTEGISLHASEALPDGTRATPTPRVTFVHDPRYSGIATIQIEGRCHRDGQFAPVYYMYAVDTAEADVLTVQLGRVHSTKAMQGDDTSTIEALEAMLDRAALTNDTAEPANTPSATHALQDGPTRTAPEAPATASRPTKPTRPRATLPPQPTTSVSTGRTATPARTAPPVANPTHEMTPEEQAFRNALAGGQAKRVSKPSRTSAEEAAFRASLRRR